MRIVETFVWTGVPRLFPQEAQQVVGARFRGAKVGAAVRLNVPHHVLLIAVIRAQRTWQLGSGWGRPRRATR